MTAFVQAALLSTVLGELAGGQQPPPNLADWATTATEEKLRSLHSGAIVLEHSGIDHAPWDVAYAFCHEGVSYRWVLAGAPTWGGIVRADTLSAGVVANIQSERLLAQLFGSGVTMTSPPTLPTPLPPFEFGAICPASDKLVPLVVQTGTSTFTADLEVHRRFTHLADITVWPTPQNRAYTAARVLRLVLNEGLVILGEQFRGIGIGGTATRQPGLYSWQELAGPPPQRELSSLPLRLFALKNGDQANRQTFEQIRRAFGALAPGRSMEIRFSATAPQTQSAVPQLQSSLPSLAQGFDNATVSEDPGQPTPGAAVTVLILDDRGRELPIVQVGAGTWEALTLAEALTASEHRTVILDEPALNLHPTWQHILRTSLRRTPGVRPRDALRRSCPDERREGDRERYPTRKREWGNSRSPAAVDNRRTNCSEDRARLHAIRGRAGVALCPRRAPFEGETELGALPGWFAAAAGQAGWRHQRS